jgi:hypothetical protein
MFGPTAPGYTADPDGGLPEGEVGQVLVVGPDGTPAWAPYSVTAAEIPAGGEPGQVLVRQGDGAVAWTSLPAEIDEVPDNGTPGWFLIKTADGVAWSAIADLQPQITALQNRATALETAPAQARYVRTLVSSTELTASGTWLKSSAPADATEVDIECVGGGASGMSCGGTWHGAGGLPGGVEQRTVQVADLPASVAFTIGAGGVLYSSSTANANPNNPGSDTSFGTLLSAAGGVSNKAFIYAISAIQYWRSAYFPSMPGHGDNNLAATDGIGSSKGPGGGGSGCYIANSRGGHGAPANENKPDLKVSGGVAAVGAAGGNGAAAPGLFQYGSGGAGGGSDATTGKIGGNGGAPGGGGGGSARGVASGAGARGAIRLHFYKWVAA